MSNDQQHRPILNYSLPARRRKQMVLWLIVWGAITASFVLICLGPPLLIDESYGMRWYGLNLPLSNYRYSLPFDKWPSIIIITVANGLIWGGLLTLIALTIVYLVRKLFW
jgi:hypothetical protein